MPYPRVTDSGERVEVDLHGASITEASRILDRLIALAAERGRLQLNVIHGSSSFEAGRPSIKQMLYDALEEEKWSVVTGAVRFEASTLLSLTGGSRRSDPTPISILDVTR
jgi:hypothetical protein